MERTSLGMVGSPDCGVVRLELANRMGQALRLDFLGGEDRGNFARVVRGQVRFGELIVPVAVKLQRDVALTREGSSGVSAKFVCEWKLYRKLREVEFKKLGAESCNVVRQLTIWPNPDEAPTIMPPSIVCRKARHALAPSCTCGVALAQDEWGHGDEGRLLCPKCTKDYRSIPPSRKLIIESTVQKDPACEGCPHQADEDTTVCLEQAAFLNFFPSHVILLELLDIDLFDYVTWEHVHGVDQSTLAWITYKAHKQARSEPAANMNARTQVQLHKLDLGLQIVAGVRQLHQHQIAHLDLKPENICLKLDGATAQVKLIDLGQAQTPELQEYLRRSGTGNTSESEFCDPAILDREILVQQAMADWSDEVCRLRIPRSFMPDWESRAQVGDAFSIMSAPRNRYVIRSIDEHGADYCLLGICPGVEVKEDQIQGDPETPTAVKFVKQVSTSADVYSIGMLLLGLLVDRFDLKIFRDALPNIRIALNNRTIEGDGSLVRALEQESEAYLEKLRATVGEVRERFGGLAEDLVDIVLRATLGRADCGSYVTRRTSETLDALDRLRRDIEAVQRKIRLRDARFTFAQRKGLIQKRVRMRRHLNSIEGEVPQDLLHPGGGKSMNQLLEELQAASLLGEFERAEELESLLTEADQRIREYGDLSEGLRRQRNKFASLVEHLPYEAQKKQCSKAIESAAAALERRDYEACSAHLLTAGRVCKEVVDKGKAKERELKELRGELTRRIRDSKYKSQLSGLRDPLVAAGEDIAASRFSKAEAHLQQIAETVERVEEENGRRYQELRAQLKQLQRQSRESRYRESRHEEFREIEKLLKEGADQLDHYRLPQAGGKVEQAQTMLDSADRSKLTRVARGLLRKIGLTLLYGAGLALSLRM